MKQSNLRILYVGMRWDYGDRRRGPSFEEVNFRPVLEAMGNEVAHFDFMERSRAVGRRRMRAELCRSAAEFSPDLVFFFLYADEIDPETIQRVGREAGCPTLNWFADDHWRFDNFTRHMAPALDWSVTTDADSLPKYEGAGVSNVILSQWACNPLSYSPGPHALSHDVTFVGQPHGGRRAQIARLRDGGHEVECWGYGWPNGRVDHQRMVEIFGSSAINLNLSSASAGSEDGQFLRRLPTALRSRLVSSSGHTAQIKGRTFEIPGCGGFQLAEYAPHLEDYFVPGDEIGTFDSVETMIDQVDYWLGHPEHRNAVAEAGYQRVLDDHTYDRRFLEIFRRIGLVQ